jgi:hypothetical protein
VPKVTWQAEVGRGFSLRYAEPLAQNVSLSKSLSRISSLRDLEGNQRGEGLAHGHTARREGNEVCGARAHFLPEPHLVLLGASLEETLEKPAWTLVLLPSSVL